MIKPEKNHWETGKVKILKHQNYWNGIVISSARQMAVGVSGGDFVDAVRFICSLMRPF